VAAGGTAKLGSIAQSRTEPASRVERARILLAYREDPSFFAVSRALGLHHQTVQRCVERAVAEGPMAALDDRPRPGREPTITGEAKAWLVSLARRKAKDLGYPHELWTTRLLARHAREHGPARRHAFTTVHRAPIMLAAARSGGGEINRSARNDPTLSVCSSGLIWADERS
jgi:transposase